MKPIYGGDSSLSAINGNLTNVLDLPDGKSLLISTNGIDGKNEIILQTDDKRIVIYSSSPEDFIERPVYSNTGHILFSLITRNATDIWAIPFDTSSLKITGNPFLIVRNAIQPIVSQNGILSYLDIDRGNGSSGEQLVLLSRSGQLLKKISQPQLEIYYQLFHRMEKELLLRVVRKVENLISGYMILLKEINLNFLLTSLYPGDQAGHRTERKLFLHPDFLRMLIFIYKPPMAAHLQNC